MSAWRGVTGFSLACVALSGVIAFEVADLPTHAVARSGSVRVTPVISHTAVPTGENDIDSERAVVLARPIFNPDRKPVGAGPKGTAGLSRLSGIVVTGSRRIAIFAAPAGEHPVVAAEGSHVDAYEVKAISDSGVTVTGPNGTTTIAPVFDPAQPAAHPAPVLPKPTGSRKP